MSEIVSQILRSGRIESEHRGIVAVVTPEGKKVATIGDTGRRTYIRSAAKPLQAIPLLRSGAAEKFGLNEKELAVIMASHNAEDFHVAAVFSILRKTSLSVEQLRCGFHRPLHRPSAARHLQDNAEKSPVYNNCSGKHAGMLIAAKMNGWPSESYLAPDHPLQVEILKEVALYTDLPPAEIERGVDGCSAPVFYLPVEKMALIYARLAQGELPFSTRVFSTMVENSEMIGGSERFDTDFMQVMGGRAISKVGAEGIRCVGIRGESPVGVTVKIEDGNVRASAGVVLSILSQLDLISKTELNRLSRHHRPQLKNCSGLDVGEIRAVCKI